MTKSVALEPLLERAKAAGWQQAFFEFAREEAARGELPLEDQRAADWRYLLRVPPNGRALVIGCGFGAVAIALAEMGMEVSVVDPSHTRAALLDLRRREQGVPRLRVEVVRQLNEIPFAHGTFDFACLQPADEAETAAELRKTVRAVAPYLKPEGQLYTALGNWWAYQRLLRPWRRHGPGPLGPASYRRLFHAEGFADVLLYAPLPHHRGIPLFYLPIDNANVLTFFLNEVFPLFNTVSPEVKGRFGLDYAAARFGAILVRRLRLAALAKHFVPSVAVIATRAAAEPHAR